MSEALLLINVFVLIGLACILMFYNARQARALENVQQAVRDWCLADVKRRRSITAQMAFPKDAAQAVTPRVILIRSTSAR